MKTERKAMIKNRNNYLPFPSKTPKGKKDSLKATTPQSKCYKQKDKMIKKKWPNGYPK